ncbi:hypothetical protein N7535_008059 [Penicillium sp. DV-2018c]|nr:hypothetical protein N7461_004095 [Penicillium sp. DV-2018c]KAJ5566421.1 hypothetical protein N7535_008059 [Penicillium sp. DV-2018c]
MPTRAHDCIFGWISTSISRACLTGFPNTDELDCLFSESGTRGFRVYAILYNPSQQLPPLVAEVGWSEAYSGLFNDVNKLLIGGNGTIKGVDSGSRGYAILYNPSQQLPPLVAEAGWSEAYSGLFNDVNQLLIGGNGIMKPHTNNTVGGVLGVQRLNQQGTPIYTQTETAFPMSAGDPPQHIKFDIAICTLSSLRATRTRTSF